MITLVGQNFLGEPNLQARFPHPAKNRPTQPIFLTANRNSEASTVVQTVLWCCRCVVVAHHLDSERLR